MTTGPRCPRCRRRVRPGDGRLVGAWYCDHCKLACLDTDVIKDEPAGKVVRGPWR